MKRTIFLLALLTLLTSCAPEPSIQPPYIPIGIQILAYIGCATLVVLLGIFICAFGPFFHVPRDSIRD